MARVKKVMGSHPIKMKSPIMTLIEAKTMQIAIRGAESLIDLFMRDSSFGLGAVYIVREEGGDHFAE